MLLDAREGGLRLCGCRRRAGKTKSLLLTLVFPSCHLRVNTRLFAFAWLFPSSWDLPAWELPFLGWPREISLKWGGDSRGKVKRWDSPPVPSCGHRASSTHCHPFQVKCWELAALGAASSPHPEFLVATKGNIGFMFDGRTSSRQADLMRLWAPFSCFKPQRDGPEPKTWSQTASYLSKSGLWLVPPFSEQASASHPPPRDAGCVCAVLSWGWLMGVCQHLAHPQLCPGVLG